MPAVAAALGSSAIKTQLGDRRLDEYPGLEAAADFRAPGTQRPDNSGFNAMAQRYRTKFNGEPTRLATLSYDAVTLAGALARNPDSFSQKALTAVSGFNGADGVFRFRADGTNERGLAVMEIDNNAATVISPSPGALPPGDDGPNIGRLKRAWAADDTLQPQ